MKYGLQLYSVRDAAKDSVENMLSRVAEMGYSMVESAGFYDLTAAELKALLQKNGLTLCSTHTSVRRLTEEPAKFLSTIHDFTSYIVEYLS